MASFITNPIAGFFTCKNLIPSCALERIGDWLLNPLDLVVSRRQMMIFKEKHEKKSYNYPFDLTGAGKTFYSTVLKIGRCIALPLVVPGMIVKAISLINSNTRRTYTNWTPSLSVLQSMEAILDAPQNYVAKQDDIFWDGSHRFILPFEECACCQSSHFDRTKNLCRSHLEDQMIADLKELHLGEKEQLNYLSLGSGGLLQEVINIGKLIRAGRSNLNIFLVDKQTHPKLVGFFSALMKTYAISHQSTVKVAYFETMNVLREEFPETKMNIISAIDYDDFENDKAIESAFQAQEMIAPFGKMYLAYQTLAGLPQKQNIDCAWFDWRSFYLMGPQVVVQTAGQLGCRHLRLRIISEKSWSIPLIERYLALFAPPDMKVTVEKLAKADDYFALIQNKEMRDHIVVVENLSANSRSDFLDQLKRFQISLPQTPCYFGSGGALWKSLGTQSTLLYAENKAVADQFHENDHDLMQEEKKA